MGAQLTGMIPGEKDEATSEHENVEHTWSISEATITMQNQKNLDVPRWEQMESKARDPDPGDELFHNILAVESSLSFFQDLANADENANKTRLVYSENEETSGGKELHSIHHLTEADLWLPPEDTKAEVHERECLEKALANLWSLRSPKDRSKSDAFKDLSAAQPPNINIVSYVRRLSKYCMCSSGDLVLALVYIERLKKKHPDFVLNSLNTHRVIAVAVIVACKYHNDDYYKNSFYAEVAGVKLKELNRMEATFLQLLEWKVYVSTSDFEIDKGVHLYAQGA